MTLPLHRLNFVPEMIAPPQCTTSSAGPRAASRAQFEQPPIRVRGRGRSGRGRVVQRRNHTAPQATQSSSRAVAY